MNFANASSRRSDYENDEKMNDICFFTLQNKLKNVIAVNIDLFAKNDFIIEKIKKNEKFDENDFDMRKNVVSQTMLKKKSKKSSAEKIHMKIHSRNFSIKLKNFNSKTRNAKSEKKTIKRRQIVRKKKLKN